MRLFSRFLKEEALDLFISKEIKQWPCWNALVKDYLERFGYYIDSFAINTIWVDSHRILLIDIASMPTVGEERSQGLGLP